MAKDKTIVTDKKLRRKQVDGRNKLRHERNRAYFIIFVLFVIIGVQAVGLMVLSDWQKVIPVIAVMDSNGHILKQEIVSKEKMMADEAIVQREIYSFIQAANTFDVTWRQYYADLTHIRATPSVAQQYDYEISNSNTSNPFYSLPHQKARLVPKITGINKIEKNMYQVKFQLYLEDVVSEERKMLATIQPLYFTALVKYNFTGKPLALGDRWENPLGFVVTEYRKDQELSQ